MLLVVVKVVNGSTQLNSVEYYDLELNQWFFDESIPLQLVNSWLAMASSAGSGSNGNPVMWLAGGLFVQVQIFVDNRTKLLILIQHFHQVKNGFYWITNNHSKNNNARSFIK
jgi:hypothetical protein